jgi:predicted deacylase
VRRASSSGASDHTRCTKPAVADGGPCTGANSCKRGNGINLSMEATNFNLQQFGRGQKYAFDLELDGEAKGLSLPVLLACGRKAGKTLVVTAGVHGDEYEGVQTILDTYAGLDAEKMNGNFLAVPVANPPAFWSGTRTSPLDGENLARAFPGRLGKGPTAAIAHYLARSVIACADFYLDLHSAGVKLLMPTLVGYYAPDSRAQGAALSFGAPVVWAHPTISPGRTISYANEHGIPWLYTEARGAGRIHPDDIRIFCQGIRNLMQHLSILPGDPSATVPRHRLYGDGDIDASLMAQKRGFLISNVELLHEVAIGQELGRLVDLHGETIETFCAPREGVAVMIRQWPVMESGEPAFLITGVCPRDVG